MINIGGNKAFKGALMYRVCWQIEAWDRLFIKNIYITTHLQQYWLVGGGKSNKVDLSLRKIFPARENNILLLNQYMLL